MLRLIPTTQLESLLLYRKTTKNSAFFAFYMDNILGAFKSHQKQSILLYNHCFLCIVRFGLKFMLPKIKIMMIRIFALEIKHNIGRKVRLKLDKIEKIFIWPVF